MALSFLCVKVVVVGVQPHNTSHIGDTNDTHRNHFFTHNFHSFTYVGTRSVRLSHIPHHYGSQAPKGHTMTPERRERIEEHDSPLTANELALGWHFCPEFDGMLTSGEPTNRDTPEALLICACGNKINPNTCITYEGEEPHGTRDTFVPPPVKCDDDFITEFEKALDLLTEVSMTTTNNTMMTPSRWLQLTMNGGHITPLERVEGWHYCPRLDDKLTKIQNNICKLCGADQGPDPLDLVVCPPDEPTVPDPNKFIVHQHNDQWYFWEETYSQRIGPYSTEIAANKALDHYCDVVLGQGRDPS